jgi:hypothetical protein
VAQADLEKLSTQATRSYLPQATIGDFTSENLDDPEKPYIVRFSLSYPGFARSTGSRLELVSAVLPLQVFPAFTATTRTRSVVFPFAWSEEDAVTIELPEGYELEGRGTTQPASMKNGLGTQAFTTDIKDGTLIFRRSVTFGRGTVVVPVEDYPQVKTFFDTLRSARGPVLLRRKGESGAR